MRPAVAAATALLLALAGCASTSEIDVPSARHAQLQGEIDGRRFAMYAHDDDLVVERGPRTLVLRGGATWGRMRGRFGAEGFDLDFPEARRHFLWEGDDVSLAGKSHGLGLPGEYTLGADGEILEQPKGAR
jgi:hypothetical protein